MSALAKELRIIIHLVSHLASPEGKPHEEGGRVMIKHFKGSRAIGFWCHAMYALERNQQPEEDDEKRTTFRILKDRFAGRATGKTIMLDYNRRPRCSSKRRDLRVRRHHPARRTAGRLLT
jgi:twinkle protein